MQLKRDFVTFCEVLDVLFVVGFPQVLDVMQCHAIQDRFSDLLPSSHIGEHLRFSLHIQAWPCPLIDGRKTLGSHSLSCMAHPHSKPRELEQVLMLISLLA